MRQALELALEALQVATTPLAKDRQEVLRAITAIKEAMAQPEQEPVAQCTESDSWNCKYCRKTESCKALQDPRNFASPPQRKPRCSVCGTTENVRYMGGYQPYLCDSVDCIPF